MKWLAVAVMLLVAGLSLLASLGYGPAYFGFVNRIPGRDLTAHFVLMGLLCFTTNLGLSTESVAGRPLGVIRCTALVLVVVTLEELLQIFIRARSFSLADLYASYFGVFVFGIAAGLVLYLRKRPADGRG